MTVIVSITDGDTIYMGGDRAASDEECIVSLSRPKIHVKDGWIFGYSGSLGTGQLMEFVNFPDPYKDDPYKLLRLDVVSNLKRMMDSNGDADKDNGTDFLIGTRGRVFEFNTSDWSVAEVDEVAVGSGSHFALGSLYTSIDKAPIERIGLALSAAITYSPTCQGPIDVLTLEANPVNNVAPIKRTRAKKA